MKDGMADAALKLMQDYMRGPGARIEMDDMIYDAACIAARLVHDDALYKQLRAEMREKGIPYYSEHDEEERVRTYRNWDQRTARVNTMLEQEGFDAARMRERIANAKSKRQTE